MFLIFVSQNNIHLRSPVPASSEFCLPILGIFSLRSSNSAPQLPSSVFPELSKKYLTLHSVSCKLYSLLFLTDKSLIMRARPINRRDFLTKSSIGLVGAGAGLVNSGNIIEDHHVSKNTGKPLIN